MHQSIEADWGTLLRQAWKTAAEFMTHAVREIDELFGEGFARSNPGLVAAFMEAATKDFNNATMFKAIENGAYIIAAGISRKLGELDE